MARYFPIIAVFKILLCLAFPQFAELWKLVDLLVRKDFRQANLGLTINEKLKLRRTSQLFHDPYDFRRIAHVLSECGND
jgi:hypothetical protein